MLSSGGVFAGGTFEVIARTPKISVSRPTLISIVEGTAAVSRAYRANMDEDDDFPPVCNVKPWLPQCKDRRRRQLVCVARNRRRSLNGASETLALSHSI